MNINKNKHTLSSLYDYDKKERTNHVLFFYNFSLFLSFSIESAIRLI